MGRRRLIADLGSGDHLAWRRSWRHAQLTAIVATALVLGTASNAWAGTATRSEDHRAPGADGAPGATGRGPSGSELGELCHEVFHGPAAGSLVKTTSAGPDGSTVLPGQLITVTLTWKPSEFVWTAPSRIADCVEIGSTISPTLSEAYGPGPTTGTFTFTYVVPAGGTGGQQICDRGVAWGRDDRSNTWASGHGEGWGHDDNTERSAVLCYSILAAQAPEAPMALLFPLAGLVVGGGALVFVRRRRAGTRVDA